MIADSSPETEPMTEAALSERQVKLVERLLGSGCLKHLVSLTSKVFVNICKFQESIKLCSF
jgi:hypothetical protein